nr:integrase arm-type DNA-binding domain-containing protein [uncultured Cohaesibacter sp.]
MPRRAKEMTALQVKRIQHSGKKVNDVLTVGGVKGLKLQITPTGAKSWLVRYTSPTHLSRNRKPKVRDMGLGSYPEVSLKDARDKAFSIWKLVLDKIDPIDEAKKQEILRQSEGFTIRSAIKTYFENVLEPSVKADKTKKQWYNSMHANVVPMLGSTLVKEVDTKAVVALLEPIWLVKPRAAADVRVDLENLLDWATHKEMRSGDNPARWKGNLEFHLPKQSKKKRHQPALQLKDVERWFAEVRCRSGNGSRALEFLALTVLRSETVREMVWNEVDEVAGLWVIPAEKMKMDNEHRVPLSNEALELLKKQPRNHPQGLVFPALKGGILSDMTLSKGMKRIHLDDVARGGAGYIDPKTKHKKTGEPRHAVPHGIRSTFKDWAGELTHFDKDMTEIALAHQVGSEVERAYKRLDMLQKRRVQMQAWADYLYGRQVTNKLVQFKDYI